MFAEATSTVASNFAKLVFARATASSIAVDFVLSIFQEQHEVTAFVSFYLSPCNVVMIFISHVTRHLIKCIAGK